MTTSSTQTQTSQQSAPWSVQQPYLNQAFGQASTNLTNANNNTYTGEQVANLTPEQLATYKQMLGYGSNTGAASSTTNAGASAAGAGSSAISTALNGLNGFNASDPTASNIASAQQYANNPAISGMVKAAMQSETNQANESTLPSIQRNDAISGNTMSTKDAIQQGIVQRGLNTDAGNIASNLEGQAYNTGLSTAEQAREANNNSNISAMSSALNGGNSALSSGSGAVANGVNSAGNLFNLATTGGAGGQTYQQNQDTNAIDMSQYANQSASQNLQNFYNIIGAQNWGGTQTGTGTQTSTPSLWNTLGSALGVGASLYKLSDARMKRDLKLLGHFNTLPVYEFKYLDSDEPHVGFMAQDVEKVVPEAVVEIAGIKHVNYRTALGL